MLARVRERLPVNGPAISMKNPNAPRSVQRMSHFTHALYPSPPWRHRRSRLAPLPFIDDRRYPAELAGERYPDGIQIHPEEQLERLIRELKVEDVVFSYSDISHEYVMHMASRVLATGANFELLGPNETMLDATVPVVAVCAVRTGAGKSQTTRKVADTLRTHGKTPVVVRHPMPYGNLVAQRVQRFQTLEDLD